MICIVRKTWHGFVMKKRVGVIGVTGFVGRYVAAALAARGDEVIGYSRSGSSDPSCVTEWRKSGEWDFSGLDAIVNLAGERVDQRWTSSNKLKFEQSRIGVTRSIVSALARMADVTRPKTWINASAVGYYGNRQDEWVDEFSSPGDGYLAQLCIDWERATAGVETLGVRCVMVRIGMVLGRGGMAWDRLRLVFSLAAGARLGDGTQWMPWIHVDDLVAGILFSLDHPTMKGPANGVAPLPERNRDFTRKLAGVLRRPAPWVAPGFFLRLIFGEFGDFLLGGQRVKPRVWEDAGFVFRHPTAESALRELCATPGRSGAGKA
ncbi:MAG: hypothetical protein RI957_1101 [Verrucomicrobiota bacterium]